MTRPSGCWNPTKKSDAPGKIEKLSRLIKPTLDILRCYGNNSAEKIRSIIEYFAVAISDNVAYRSQVTQVLNIFCSAKR